MKASDPQSPFFPHKDELHTYQTVENKILQNGLKIIELLPKVSDFMSLDGNELDKARLVKIVLSSPILKHRTIEFSYEKPFDVLLENVREKNWWTNPSNKQRPQPHVIIELPFLARVHSRERISDPTGRQRKRHYFSCIFKEVTKGLAIPGKVNLHRLRHSYATSLLSAGLPITTLKKLLGHHSIQMTLGYAAVTQETIRNEYFTALSKVRDRYEVMGNSFKVPDLKEGINRSFYDARRFIVSAP